MFIFFLGLFVGVTLGLILAGLLQAARWGEDGESTPSRKRPE
jgi:hypothetical protein